MTPLPDGLDWARIGQISIFVWGLGSALLAVFWVLCSRALGKEQDECLRLRSSVSKRSVLRPSLRRVTSHRG
jgi:hypothetical protein